jgi:heat shock protein HspQ
MEDIECKFSVGQLINHNRFNYRGVIVDVDPNFQGTEEWYNQVAKSRPPKENPWYHVIVDNASHMTYVAERHLEVDTTGKAIQNPLIADFFSDFQNSEYITIIS